MSSFNVDLNVADLQVVFDKPAEDAEVQTIESAKLIQVIGLTIPLGDPRANMAGLIGLGTVSSLLTAEMLEKLIASAQEALDLMVKPPKLPADFAIAGNMEQAKAFDSELKRATGRG